MGEWKTVRFGDLYKVPSRNGVSKPSRIRGEGYKMINMGEHFAYDRIYDVPMELVPLTDNEKVQAKVEKGDLLFARQSLVASGAGRCDIVCEVSNLTVFESHLIRVRLNDLLADPLFYYYYFRSGCSSMSSIVQHVVQAGIRASDLADLSVDIPPLPTQRKIAAVLGALDDKIENNRKICANLEAQAQAIFKSWFVDFEPFGGKMPQGWKMGKLGDVAELMRQTITPNEMVEVVEHYSLSAYDEARYPSYDNSDNIKSNKFKVGNDSILVSKLNPAIKRLWDPFVDTETAVASTEFVVINPRDTRNRYFVYGVLDSPAFYAYAKSNVSGTTNSHQRISPEQILCFETVLPDEKWIEKFCDVVSPMYWGIKKRIKESRSLAATRDALLPKLMSGEIDVEKVEVQEVVK